MSAFVFLQLYFFPLLIVLVSLVIVFYLLLHTPQTSRRFWTFLSLSLLFLGFSPLLDILSSLYSYHSLLLSFLSYLSVFIASCLCFFSFYSREKLL